MKIIRENDYAAVAATLRAGGVVVLRTDTLYGIVARADDEKSCDTIFAIKQRDADKACIVLVANEMQMWDGVSRQAYDQMRHHIDSESPTSIIVPVGDHTPAWIHHGKQDVAFRIPLTRPWLLDVLKQSGPIIAPSANLQGYPPARTIEEAVEYFGAAVDLYVDGGAVSDLTPSRLIRLDHNGAVERLR